MVNYQFEIPKNLRPPKSLLSALVKGRRPKYYKNQIRKIKKGLW
jgi:hypothetical protein